jgi:hypothetical protein
MNKFKWLCATLTAIALAALASPAFALQAVGPTDPTIGFPTWYQDPAGITLAPCLDNDAMCLFGLPDPNAPLTFPGNFPDEMFYWMGASAQATNAGGQAMVEFAIEGTFTSGVPTPGEQIVFARMRVRMDNLVTGATYRITHPFGVHDFVATAAGKGGVNTTVDVGLCPGDFSGALKGATTAFLQWDPAESPAPAGYVGDPGVPHTVIGSPLGTNFVRIEGPSIGGPGIDSIQNNNFTVVGKLFTGAMPIPLRASRATYVRTATATYVTVFGESVAAATLAANSALTGTFALTGDGVSGRFVGTQTLPAGAALPTHVTVYHTGDATLTPVTIALVDQVTVTDAVYDPISRRLQVKAFSADSAAVPTLTASGLGQLDATGTLLAINVLAPKTQILVLSSLGGAASISLRIAPGALPAPLPPVAQAGADSSAAIGATVTLVGSTSGATPLTQGWTQVSGPSVILTSTTATSSTFVAPAVTTSTALVFRFTASSDAGSTSDDVTVFVNPAPPVAVVAPIAPVALGSTVQLVGTGSTGSINKYQWTQVSGPAVVISNATSAIASFVFPANAAVGAPGGVATITLALTVTGPAGSSTAQVSVTNQPTIDVLTATTVRYRISKARWDIAGTATITSANKVTAYLNAPMTGPIIGSATVSATGAWTIQILGSKVPATATSKVYLVSAKGGQLGPLAVTVTKN